MAFEVNQFGIGIKTVDLLFPWADRREVYEAATNGKDQFRYIAGADAKAMYAMRSQLGEEAFRKAMAQQFLWRCTKSGIALELML
jgi:hypothetical protein